MRVSSPKGSKRRKKRCGVHTCRRCELGTNRQRRSLDGRKDRRRGFIGFVESRVSEENASVSVDTTKYQRNRWTAKKHAIYHIFSKRFCPQVEAGSRQSARPAEP
ncbi:hypothetical protein BaRGS_00029096 [Batillaria attramentaria]|uniref:Uncharacterized protein n=1 Tax=Batillaria attramentaria TaxID=370345 RepID=A0ABD0JWX9_9CAEN